ncbi:MAG: type II toxin-antitoxin system YafQ family toxin [Dysgonamonadaceae bacterium]|jgi:mRNA interferase YafQ|nr:type II toxin-antitoxin system YafQ family toxin [Dysgonamonadaceae bacterium]
MKKVHYSTRMKKDLKKYRNNPVKMKKLYEVLNMLINDIELPETFKAHKLLGQYKGCMECHIEGDFLLIWFDEDSGIIELLRLGTHSELF